MTLLERKRIPGRGWQTVEADFGAPSVLNVASGGNDSTGDPYRTFNAAIQAAVSLGPAADNRFVVQCMDAADYNENVVCAPYVDIHAPSASIVGDGAGILLLAADHSSVRLFGIRGGDGDGDPDRIMAIGKIEGTSQSYVDVREIILGDYAIGAINYGENAKLMVNIGLLQVGDNSFGVGADAAAPSAGHIHAEVGDIYVGASSAGLIAANAGSIVSRLDHILPVPSGATGAVGVYVATTTGYVSVLATQIRTDVGLFFTPGSQLNVVCPFITGTLTGLPAAGASVISDQLVYLPDAPATFFSVTP